MNARQQRLSLQGSLGWQGKGREGGGGERTRLAKRRQGRAAPFPAVQTSSRQVRAAAAAANSQPLGKGAGRKEGWPRMPSWAGLGCARGARLFGNQLRRRSTNSHSEQPLLEESVRRRNRWPEALGEEKADQRIAAVSRGYWRGSCGELRAPRLAMQGQPANATTSEGLLPGKAYGIAPNRRRLDKNKEYQHGTAQSGQLCGFFFGKGCLLIASVGFPCPIGRRYFWTRIPARLLKNQMALRAVAHRGN